MTDQFNKEISVWLQEPPINQLLFALKKTLELAESAHVPERTLDEAVRRFTHRLADVVRLGSSPHVSEKKQKTPVNKELRQVVAEFKYKFYIAYPTATEDFEGVVSAKLIASLRNLKPFRLESRRVSCTGLFSLKSPYMVAVLEKLAAGDVENLKRLRRLFAKTLDNSQQNFNSLPVSTGEALAKANKSSVFSSTLNMKTEDDATRLSTSDTTHFSLSQTSFAQSLVQKGDSFNDLHGPVLPIFKYWKPFLIGALTGAGLVVIGQYFCRAPEESCLSARVSNICLWPTEGFYCLSNKSGSVDMKWGPTTAHSY